MSPARPPAPAPQLPGFEFVKPLGSGGFADVHLYRQLAPLRDVAVKVLLPDAVGRQDAVAFSAEANVMAQLSAHPFIVTIYEVGAAADGRPYLVMEYCPRPNLQQRYRKERISVAEAIRIGVQVAGAVETSHRAGILHRDIKPANILTTSFNRPALTDFGIAATVTQESSEAVAGMSIPWSPPESFVEPARATPQSDVWALAATVYSLLASRSPFEVPGGRNGQLDLIDRIERSPLPALGRADVPASLEAVLAAAMAKRDVDRYPTAIALGRALQKVQIELGLSVTAIDVMDDAVDVDEEEDEGGDATRIRSVTSVDPDAGSTTSRASRPRAPGFAPPADTSDRTVAALTVDRMSPDALGDTIAARRSGWTPPAGGASAPPSATPGSNTGSASYAVRYEGTVDATQRRAPAQPGADSASAIAEAVPQRRRIGLLVGVTAGVVAAGVIAVVAASALQPSAPKAQHTADHPQQAVAADVVPAPGHLKGVASADGTQVTFTWSDPSPHDGDRFLWGVAVPGSSPQLTATSETSVTVPASKGQTCIQVSLRRSDGRTSDDPVTGCVP